MIDVQTDTEELQSRPLSAVAGLARDLRNAAEHLSDAEARFLVDTYYIMQEQRIRNAAQVRSIGDGEPCDVLQHFFSQFGSLESQCKGALDRYTRGHVVGGWLRATKGVGPVISAGLLAHIDITRCPTPGHIYSFAGLDPKREWNKGEKRPWNARLKTLCCRPDQRVLTKAGYRPIRDVKVGDEVLTHLGRWRRVTQIFVNPFDGELVHVKASGRASFGPMLTPYHPVYARRNIAYYWKDGERQRWSARRNTKREIGFERAEEMRALKAGGMAQREIAHQLGVSEACVSTNVNGLRNAAPIVETGWARADAIQPGWDLFFPRIPHIDEPCIFDLAQIKGALDLGDEVIAQGRWDGVPAPRGVALPRYIEIDERWARFIGLYLAEGHVHRNTVGLAFHENETEYQYFVEEFLSELGLSVYKHHNVPNRCIQLSVVSKILSSFLRTTFGKGAHEKTLPMSIIERLDNSTLRALLRGLYDGDGTVSGDGELLGTVSEQLAYAASVAIHRIGDVASVSKYNAFFVRWAALSNRHEGHKNGVMSFAGQLGRETYKGDVYNLEVDEDESYVCEGVAVHNCYKIGESFVKTSGGKNPGYYGLMYADRKQQEIAKNEAHEFAEQASAELEKKNYRAKTVAKEAYAQGMLPPAHIHARARRYAVKRFLSDLHCVWYYIHHGEPPALPYAIAHGGHAHPIFPPHLDVVPGLQEALEKAWRVSQKGG